MPLCAGEIEGFTPRPSFIKRIANRATYVRIGVCSVLPKLHFTKRSVDVFGNVHRESKVRFLVELRTKSLNEADPPSGRPPPRPAPPAKCSGHNYIPVSDKWRIGVDLCSAESGRPPRRASRAAWASVPLRGRGACGCAGAADTLVCVMARERAAGRYGPLVFPGAAAAVCGGHSANIGRG
ncbi:hypothetical protein EVAR_60957_1 [Eumeta japonica]|uniref:Uncharacterized protein n=1 Tax=Eumeta variegata TaxID=151549 RepID=A0A4C1XUV7_EUMVA|nr:hypothetical protein EVAR_60957_1 [Eumeta japonica]